MIGKLCGLMLAFSVAMPAYGYDSGHLNRVLSCQQTAERAALHELNEVEKTIRRAEQQVEGLSEDGSAVTPACDFTNADLSAADLGEVNLDQRKLVGANLQSARLAWASMVGVDLTGAVLIRANLRNADLSRATLLGTALDGADLRGAKLDGALMRGATLCNTVMPDGHVEFGGC